MPSLFFSLRFWHRAHVRSPQQISTVLNLRGFFVPRDPVVLDTRGWDHINTDRDGFTAKIELDANDCPGSSLDQFGEAIIGHIAIIRDHSELIN